MNLSLGRRNLRPLDKIAQSREDRGSGPLDEDCNVGIDDIETVPDILTEIPQGIIRFKMRKVTNGPFRHEILSYSNHLNTEFFINAKEGA